MGQNVLPGALVIGPMRCGTTWIDRYLRVHPHVCVPDKVKETFFFDRRFEKGRSWYASHFDHCRRGGEMRVCEIGPSYFHCPEAPRRVAEILGSPALVAVVRHPVERSYSHYLHLVRYGFTSLPLRDAVREHPEILEASRYSVQLDRWCSHHEQHNVHLLAFDTLTSSSEAFVERLAEVLDIRGAPIPEELKSPTNQGGVPRSGLAAKIGWKISDLLRERRLHGIVEFAKEIGLKDLLFAKAEGGTKPELTDEDRRWLQDRLTGELENWSELSVESGEPTAG